MKKTVLMSIKPEFANKIFDGTKRYEFRRVIFKNRNIDRIVVYASFPVMKIIGEFMVGDILEMDIDELWEATAEESGTSKDFFKAYYSGKEKGYAIRIAAVKKYEEPLSLEKTYNVRPPQSFQYI